MKQISGGRDQDLVGGMLSLRCLLEFQVEMLRIQLDFNAWNSGVAQ